MRLFHRFDLEKKDLKLLQSDWLREFWSIYQEKDFPKYLFWNTANNKYFYYRTNSVKIKDNFFFQFKKTLFLAFPDPFLTHSAMALWLRCWNANPGVLCSKPPGGSKVDSAFHSSEVNKMSTSNFWELSGKK